MTTLRALAVAALAAFPTLSCALNLDRGAAEDVARNECSDSSSCGAGECWQGACVARSGALTTVMLEISVPTTALDSQVGGFRFLQTKSGLSRSTANNVIELERAIQITGALTPRIGECGDLDSFPVEVTFTPREESYGLPVVPYIARTSPGNPSACSGSLGTQQFTVSVPPGSYDVYVKPLVQPADCELVPQLIRRRASFGGQGTAGSCLSIPYVKPQELTVVIPWLEVLQGADSLDGWTLEMLHPITGHVLSNKVTLGESDRSGSGADHAYRHALYFTPIADETVKELVRLSPPEGVVAPVIYGDRAGLQVSTSEATFPPIGPFLAPVRVSGWVLPPNAQAFGDAGAPAPSEAIPGTAIFTAQSLAGISPGVFASHSSSVTVAKDGSVTADLLPGEYRVRIVPELNSGYAATELALPPLRCTTTVANGIERCISRSDAGKPEARAGLEFKVNVAATLSGSVVDGASGEPVAQLSIEARPATSRTRTCAGEKNEDPCAAAPIGILDRSLGEAELPPRGATGFASSGSFTLNGLDCGECTAESGVMFDILARPPDHSRRAWAIQPGVRVPSAEPVQMKTSLPIIYSGTVVALPATGSSGRLVKEPSIRAYVLRDEQGQWIADPTAMSSCTMLAASGAEASRCIKSALQVGETRADTSGKFELALPSELPAPPPP